MADLGANALLSNIQKSSASLNNAYFYLSQFWPEGVDRVLEPFVNQLVTQSDAIRDIAQIVWFLHQNAHVPDTLQSAAEDIETRCIPRLEQCMKEVISVFSDDVEKFRTALAWPA